MSIDVVPHLNFRGDARKALEFYQTVFGGSLTILTYGQAMGMQDAGDASGKSTAADRELIMWGQVAAENGFKVMAFDAPEQFPFEKGQNAFYVAVNFSIGNEAKSAWEKLSRGGSVRRELGPSPWAPMYGMVQDKFGVVWIVGASA